ncbi:unnamed protein product [Didymodactylos carnosus]|uniref:Uncharacterized protein n=1 Tax=Didymodactylos carnosus TaxID=1234261 RepID=A0A8S2YRQ2_9BILA|nr:unnamed protein product [Didymodactylos carnosus]
MYDRYSSTSAVNYEVLLCAPESETLSIRPSGDEVWYVHEMRPQREIFTKAASTKIKATDNEISNDTKHSQMEPMIMRQQVLFGQQHKYHLAAGLEEHQSTCITQPEIPFTDQLDGLLEQNLDHLVYEHKDWVTGDHVTNLLTHWDWFWPYMVP